MPPEFIGTERLSGVATQRRPPTNGAAARPALEYRYRPGLLLITLVAETVKPEPDVALAIPLEPMDGVQPSELIFAVQYTVVVGKPKMRTVGACMRELVIPFYGVLKNRTPFDPKWSSKKTN